MKELYDGGIIGQMERYKARRAQMLLDGQPIYGWWFRWQRRVTNDITDEQIRREAAAAAKLQEELLP